jgi:hypothetical protein
MINWKEIYEKTLKNICEDNASNYDEIVEQEKPEFTVDLVFNENANDDALFKYKLDDNATEEDYKKFVEYIYTYIGEDVNDYIVDEQGEEDMESNKEELKIRKLLKMYGAEDGEIENFMQDLKDFKDDTEDEEDDFNYLDNDTMEKLKATEQGKDLIMNAPKMAKDELKKAIQEYLTNN